MCESENVGIEGPERVGWLESAIVAALRSRPVEPEPVAAKYHELLYAVASKFPDESRHETALRYIRNAERGPDQCEAKSSAPVAPREEEPE
ncbi:MAG TPA: hypothetical protein VNA25_22720 [Phycisphaerae bacterium]|nr:hypothetical protein [Phycisphaerae bacterium]